MIHQLWECKCKCKCKSYREYQYMAWCPLYIPNMHFLMELDLIKIFFLWTIADYLVLLIPYRKLKKYNRI